LRRQVRLAIEVDGQHHQTDWIAGYDSDRSLDLHRRGIRVVRIPNELLIRDYRMAIECIEAGIAEAIASR